MTRFDPDARPDKDAVPGVNSAGTTITPIEAMIDAGSSKKLHESAELTQQIIEERARRHAEPVHMEGLKPLPPGMPRLPNGVIPGGPDATTLVPSMRRSVPAPFARQSISAGRHGKTWDYAKAGSVLKGNLVVDFGRVDAAWDRIIYQQIAGVQAAVGVERVLLNIMGEERVFDPAEQLRVFRKHESEA